MAANVKDPERVRKLLKLFHDVTKGLRSIDTPANAKLFLEAVTCNKAPSVCLELLLSSASGSEAVRNSVRADISLEFITTHTLPFLDYFSGSEVKLLAGGQLLSQLIAIIIHPPLFWKAVISLLLNRQIPQHRLQSLAWLLHEAIWIPTSSGADVLVDVSEVVKNGSLLQDASPEVRELGYKIQKAVQVRCTTLDATRDRTVDSAGGRHDNDFADFRRIIPR